MAYGYRLDRKLPNHLADVQEAIDYYQNSFQEVFWKVTRPNSNEIHLINYENYKQTLQCKIGHSHLSLLFFLEVFSGFFGVKS